MTTRARHSQRHPLPADVGFRPWLTFPARPSAVRRAAADPLLRLLTDQAIPLAQWPTRYSITKDVGGRQEVPVATLAYLDDIDGERAELPSHPVKFGRCSNPTGIGAELVTVDVGHMYQSWVPTGRAGTRGRFPVMPCGAQEIRVRITALTGQGSTSPKGDQGLPALKGEVDHRPRSPRVFDRFRVRQWAGTHRGTTHPAGDLPTKGGLTGHGHGY